MDFVTFQSSRILNARQTIDHHNTNEKNKKKKMEKHEKEFCLLRLNCPKSIISFGAREKRPKLKNKRKKSRKINDNVLKTCKR